MAEALKAPFPYFGGKSKVTDLVWQRLGADVPNYVEPFFGSGSMLLGRPGWTPESGCVETVNDADGFVSNFWRATQAEPESVAEWADWPVNENDLHARHAWLIEQRADLTAKLEGDPGFYDVKIAGWWVWGACQWIGGGWCAGNGPWRQIDGRLVKADDGVKRQLPHLGPGMGINRQRPHLGPGMGINRKLPHLGDAGMGQCDVWSEHLRQTMQDLADRLRRVRVCSGDWSRICGPTPTVKFATPCAVFLDPPYSNDERADGCYAHDDGSVAAECLAWCIEHGDDPRLRIALCGYDGEHNALEELGWETVAWKTQGGYGNRSETRGRDNANRERIWFSPHCLHVEQTTQLQLFGGGV